jgi:hypothetical protein
VTLWEVRLGNRGGGVKSAMVVLRIFCRLQILFVAEYCQEEGKNKAGPKNCESALELIARLGLAIGSPFGKMG